MVNRKDVTIKVINLSMQLGTSNPMSPLDLDISLIHYNFDVFYSLFFQMSIKNTTSNRSSNINSKTLHMQLKEK